MRTNIFQQNNLRKPSLIPAFLKDYEDKRLHTIDHNIQGNHLKAIPGVSMLLTKKVNNREILL